MEELQTMARETIPQAMAELEKNKETIQQIADFCRDSYQGDKEAEVFQQTKDYTTNALLNVAYHVQNIATHLTTFAALQKAELDKVEVQVHTVAERVRSHYDRTGSEVYRQPESTREYEKKPKVKKLEGDAVPENARPLPKFVRGDAGEVAYGGMSAAAPPTISPRATSATQMAPPPPLPSR